MMWWPGTICTVLVLVCSSCSTVPQVSPGERAADDLRCLNALAIAGLNIAAATKGQPTNSATAVLHTISTIGASNIPVTALEACAKTLEYAQADAAKARKDIKDRTGK